MSDTPNTASNMSNVSHRPAVITTGKALFKLL
ncbi:Uncharacterised protein [Staphylococcus aureus]|nr:Uncharacterised protein [Staphylococcus aureus]